MPRDKTRILFLCTGNSCRSQMAEGWGKYLGADVAEIGSAGIEAHGKNPRAIAVMREAGVDISRQNSTRVTEEMIRRADVVVTVCGHADEHCPVLPPGVRKLHWPLNDPAKAAGTEEEIMTAFRATCDEVRSRVEQLLAEIRRDSAATRESSARANSVKLPHGKAVGSPLGLFERYLTVWVFLCIVVGIALGHWFAPVFQAVGRLEIARINLPVAALIWLMIFPMLLKVDFAVLHRVTAHWKGIGVTLFVNWGVKPFSMALLGWLFIGHLFVPWLPVEQINSYIAGLILLAAAPCTAMVFVWSHLTRGEPHFTLTQVAINDVIMVVAFAPVVGLLLGLSAITVPWETLLLSVLLYIVAPLAAAYLVRRWIVRHEHGWARLAHLIKMLHPVSLAALLATLVLLFGFQGEQILGQPLVIGLLAVPILLQVFFNSGVAYLLNRTLCSPHCVAGPSALIGASNFFELAVATAIMLFGFESGAALATVVGVLIEVPAMLAVASLVNRSRAWYERQPGVMSYAQCCPSSATPEGAARVPL